jgi:hypothetical protein
LDLSLMKVERNMSSDKTSKPSPSEKSGQVVDLADFRKKKTTDEELARGRKPLYVSHGTGKISGSPHMKRPESADFGDRLSRIRSSLEKINKLMSELKRMSASEPTEDRRESRREPSSQK